MIVIDHARLRARLLHDGVGEVLARGAVQVGELELAREADLAVCIVLRGGDHVAGSVLQVEGELAVRRLRRVIEAVRNLDGLGRRQLHGSLCGVGVVEGGSRSGTVIGDGHLRLVVVILVLLYPDVDLDFLGVVDHAVDDLAGLLLLQRVVVLAQVQVLDGQLDLAVLVVVALGNLVAGLVVQAEGERTGRQDLTREGLRRLDGDVSRRLRVGEGRHGLLIIVCDGRLQLALLVGDLYVDHYVLRVIDDGRVVAGNLLDGVVVLARRVVADCLEGDLAVLVIPDGLDHAAVPVEQLEREVVPRELATCEALRRLERYRGLLRVVRVREGLRVVSTRYLRRDRQRAGAAVRDRHLVGEGMVVVDHAGLRARLLHDGVGEVLARGAVQVGELEAARELHNAIGLVRRGVEHLAVGVLQLERVLAALQLGVVREARRDRNDLGRRQLHGSLCGVGVREGGGIGLVTIVGNSGVQLASFVHDLHHGVVHRVVEGHVGQVALLLHDGVLVLAGLGVVDDREGDGAVLAVLGGLDGLFVLQLLSRQIALVQVEGELAALERSRRTVGLHVGLLRRDRHRGLGGLIRVLEGRDIVLAVVSDGRLRLATLRLHRDVNLHHLGVVGDSRIGTDVLLLERVVVLADGQTGEGKIDLAILVVLDGLDGITRGRVTLVQAKDERTFRQVLAREGLLCLDGCIGRRPRVGEGRHGLIAVVGNGCAQRAVLVIGDADLDLHFPSVVDDGLVVTGNFLDGVLVVTGLGVVDGLEGNVAVLVVRDGLNGRAFRLVTLVQSEREFVPRERTARKELLRRQGHGTLRGIAVGKGGEVHLAVLDLRRFALVIAVLFHRHACDSQLGILVLNLHRDGVGGIVHRPTGVLHTSRIRIVIFPVGLGERKCVVACLVEFHTGEVEGLTVLAGDLPLRGLGLRGCVTLQAASLQIAGGNLILRLRRGSQRERELLVRALGAGDLLRYLWGQFVAGFRRVSVGKHQLVGFGQRAVGILLRDLTGDAIACVLQIRGTLLAAGQLIARGHLFCAGQLLHRVLVALAKTVHANRLVGLDGL